MTISNLQSLMIAPAACEWLRMTKNGRVLHIFERACNLVNEQGQVLSLVANRTGLGPFAILVEGVAHPAGFLEWVDGASEVGVEGTRLAVGKLVVETAGASLWQSRPDWASLQKRLPNLVSYWPRLRSLLAAEAPAGSVAVLEANQLGRGLDSLNIGLVQSAAHRLAGLGGGLTPAGDDLLVGVMVGLWATRPELVARMLAETIASTAVPRTTRLSAAYLAAAGRGEVAWLWHELLAAMAAAEEEEVVAVVRAILRTGHTSGADMLAGFLLI